MSNEGLQSLALGLAIGWGLGAKRSFIASPTAIYPSLDSRTLAAAKMTGGWPVLIVRCLECGATAAEDSEFESACLGSDPRHGPTRAFSVVPSTCLCSITEQHPHCPVHEPGGLRDEEAA